MKVDALDQELARKRSEIRDAWETILHANEPTVLSGRRLSKDRRICSPNLRGARWYAVTVADSGRSQVQGV